MSRAIPSSLPRALVACYRSNFTFYPLCRRLSGPEGAENLAHIGVRTLNRQVHSESLYRLRCPGPHFYCFLVKVPSHLSRVS